MLNYSLDVFYCPIICEIYSNVILITLVFNTIAFLFMLYAIIFKATTLGIYRWLLLKSFVLGYTVDLVICLVHLTFFLPAIIFQVDGLLKYTFGAKASFLLMLTVACFKMGSILYLVIYRCAMCFPGRFQELLKKTRYLLFSLIILYSGISVPLIGLTFVDFYVWFKYFKGNFA